MSKQFLFTRQVKVHWPCWFRLFLLDFNVCVWDHSFLNCKTQQGLLSCLSARQPACLSAGFLYRCSYTCMIFNKLTQMSCTHKQKALLQHLWLFSVFFFLLIDLWWTWTNNTHHFQCAFLPPQLFLLFIGAGFFSPSSSLSTIIVQSLIILILILICVYVRLCRLLSV